MMTTRERILLLYDNGTEPHVIAATLGLTVTDVAKTLAEPGFTPPEIGGGGGVPDSRWSGEAPPGLLLARNSYDQITNWQVEGAAGSDIAVVAEQGFLLDGGGKAYLVQADLTGIKKPVKAGATSQFAGMECSTAPASGEGLSVWETKLADKNRGLLLGGFFVLMGEPQVLRVLLAWDGPEEGEEEVDWSGIDILRVR